MIELLRRLLLLAGLCLAAWHFWFTPPALIAARVVDFNLEYQQKYLDRPRHSFGAMAAGEALIRSTTNPGSAAAYRDARMSSRPLPPNPALSADWADNLAAAVLASGPFASRFSHGYVYFDSSDPAIAPFALPLRQSLRRTSFLNAYTRAGARDIELMLFPEPRSSSAPASVLYPLRQQAWIFAAAALILYFLLGLASRSNAVRHDPLPLMALDLIAASAAAFFFALPFRLCDSTQAALDDPLGGPIWSWAVSLLLLAALFSLARRSAWRLHLDPAALRIQSLFSSTLIPLSLISAVCFHTSPDGSEQSGLDLRLSDGRTIFLDWTGTLDFPPVLDYLQHQGYLIR